MILAITCSYPGAHSESEMRRRNGQHNRLDVPHMLTVVLPCRTELECSETCYFRFTSHTHMLGCHTRCNAALVSVTNDEIQAFQPPFAWSTTTRTSCLPTAAQEPQYQLKLPYMHLLRSGAVCTLYTFTCDTAVVTMQRKYR